MALRSDWSWVIASALIDAALSCGAECDRHWVSDGSRIEQPAPGCPCQLVASVREGIEAAGSGAPVWPIGCGSSHFAEVTLSLDLCTESPPGPDAVPQPVPINTRAQANASTRWLMLRGIQAAWAAGLLTVDTDDPPMPVALAKTWKVRPGEWRQSWSTGGMARWDSVWRFTDEGESPPGPFGS